MGLTDVALRKAHARERPYELSDGRGLCLLVQPNGSKSWRYRTVELRGLLEPPIVQDHASVTHEQPVIVGIIFTPLGDSKC
jgi:hypothetical protein